MEASDFYKKAKQCQDAGLAVKEPGSDRLFCRKFKGSCSLNKCVDKHNKS